jgi:hypothetical protein
LFIRAKNLFGILKLALGFIFGGHLSPPIVGSTPR